MKNKQLREDFGPYLQDLIDKNYVLIGEEFSPLSFGNAVIIFDHPTFKVEIIKDRSFYSVFILSKNMPKEFSINQFSRFLNREIVLLEETTLHSMLDYLLKYDSELQITLANPLQLNQFHHFLAEEAKAFEAKLGKSDKC